MRVLLASLTAAVALAAPPAAGAKQLVFASHHCADAADREARGAPAPFPMPGVDHGCIPAIWSASAHGTPPQRLTTGLEVWGDSRNTSGDSSPAWSPDGRRIVFARAMPDAAGGSRIWVMNADGSEQRQLTFNDGAGFYFDDQPRWSTDGRRIVFTSARPNGGNLGGRIFTMAADGSGVRALPTPPGQATSPRYEGDSIVFAHRSETEGGPLRVMRIAADGSGAAVALTEAGLAVGGPGTRFAPGGRRVALPWALATVLADLRTGATTIVAGAVDEWISRDSYLLRTASEVWLVAPGIPPRRLLAQSAGPVDWYPDAAGTADDESGPLVLWGLRGTSARRALRYAAVDPSGVRGVDAALAHEVRGGCRYRRPGGWTATRRCRSARWVATGGPRAWNATLGALPQGRYRLAYRAGDRLGNSRAGAPRRFTVR